tara:strand:- start:385 stop:495 length:111 start_codon:yes stop_codon:yes gene_type:complete
MDKIKTHAMKIYELAMDNKKPAAIIVGIIVLLIILS